MSRHGRIRLLVLFAVIGAAMLANGRTPALAGTARAWWRLNSTAAPTYLPPSGSGQILVTADNVGDGEVDGASETVTFSDELPAGVVPVSVEGIGTSSGPDSEGEYDLDCPAHPEHPQIVTCEADRQLPAYERLFMRISVKTTEAAGPLLNTVKVKGGETPGASLSKPLTTGEAETPFGVEALELGFENGGGTGEGAAGSPDVQAGSHPFQLTQTLDFNQTLASYDEQDERGVFPSAPALPRDLSFKLPPGLAGYPSAVPQCSDTDFTTNAGNLVDLCPADTAIGVAAVTINDPIPLGFTTLSVPVFNLEPAPGEPARLGFYVANVAVVIRTAVRTGGDYAVEASVRNASQAVQILSSEVTLWGVPGDSRHDQSRGWECLGDGRWEAGREPPVPCKPQQQTEPTAFLTLPTSCQQQLTTSVSGESWPTGEHGTVSLIEGEDTSYTLPALSGCGGLEFNPAIALAPEEHAANTPTGLEAEVRMPQKGLLETGKLGESAIQTTTVTLPAGMQLNPSAANGLGVCPALAFGFEGSPETAQTRNLAFNEALPACPDASKVGSVSIETPLLKGQKITGWVYLAEQNTDPFKPPLALYLLAEDPTSGVLVKLAGTVTPLASGQVLTSFENTPELPFDDLKLHIFGGERAPLSTPPKCGGYAASSSFTGWSGAVRTPPSDPSFQITSGPSGSACADPLPFSPSFAAGAADSQAGAFTPFTVRIGHADSDQPLERITVNLPPGIAATLADVSPCSEEAALTDSCGPESLVGRTTASAGLGKQPVTLPGVVYLTGALKAGPGHGAAPFGLLAVTHAAAGPFDLGEVSVLSALEIDPSTAAVTVRSEPIPKLVDGVPVELKQLQVTVERPDGQPFEFNPTNCSPMSIAATLSGYEGASTEPSNDFQVSGCESLPFAPTLSASAGGHGTKADGTNLDVSIQSAGLGQANIAKVDLQLPIALSSRLSTIQQACTEAAFDANPAGCDEGSVIGYATVDTPVLRNPLSGPAYLVSHGGAAFPDVEFVLQGEGIRLVLDGKTDIKNGITYSKFESAPDAPFTSFETVLPAGPHSALTANVPEKEDFSLCRTSLWMPTRITAQDGAVIEHSTPIAVTGCGAVLSSKAKLTRAQLLKNALKACRTKHKHSRRKRAACEKQARKRYGPKNSAHKPKKSAHKPRKAAHESDRAAGTR